MPRWVEGAGSSRCGRCQRCPHIPASTIAARLHQPRGRTCSLGRKEAGRVPVVTHARLGGALPGHCSALEGLLRVLHCWEGAGWPPWLLQLQGRGHRCTAWGETVCVHSCACDLLLPSQGATAVLPPLLHPPLCLGPLVVICSFKC